MALGIERLDEMIKGLREVAEVEGNDLHVLNCEKLWLVIHELEAERARSLINA